MLNEAEAQQIENSINNRISRLAAKYQPTNDPISFDDAERLEQLVKELSSADSARQSQIISALCDSGSIAIVPLAKSYYAHTRTPKGGYFNYQPDVVRLTIAAILYELGEYFELSAVLSSQHGHIKPAMKEALTQANDEVTQLLIRALSDPKYQETDLPYWSARALGELRETRAILPLIALLHHPKIDTRSAAADSLGQIGDPQALEALRLMEKTDNTRSSWNFTGSEVATRAIKNIQSQS